MTVGLLVIDEYESGGTTTWLQHLMSATHSPIVAVRREKFRTELGISEDRDVRIRKVNDIVDYLNSCDHVLLQATLDGTQLKRRPTRSWWEDVIERVTVPWSFFTHADSRITFELSPNVGWLTSLPRFSGVVLSHSLHRRDRFNGRVHLERLPLPYRLRWEDETVECYPRVLTLSRLRSEKNWSYLIRLAQLMEGHGLGQVHLSLAGGGADSPGESSSFQVWKRLVADGARNLEEWDSPSNPHKVQPWGLQLPNGVTLTYHGRFDHELRGILLAGSKVLLNPTPRIGGSFGPVEYVTLEAMDAGLLAVQSYESGAYDRHLKTLEFMGNSRIVQTPKVMAGKHDDVALAMLSKVQRALSTSLEAHEKVAAENRSAIAEHHDPDVIVSRILGAIS